METQIASPAASATPVIVSKGAPAPLPDSTSSALAALLSPEDAHELHGLDSFLSSGRLGVASSLFRALNLKHAPTAAHCLRVAIGCSLFSRFLQIDEALREKIEIAALLHDIGKLGIPDEILAKPTHLDTQELQRMGQHSAYAIHILEAFCGDQETLNIIKYSDAWFDGTRAPESNVMGEGIPLGSRVLAIQDAFDAMTTDTPYRNALPRDRALAELFEHAGSQFDPKLVEAFNKVNAKSVSAQYAKIVREWATNATNHVDGNWCYQGAAAEVSSDPKVIFQERLLESMHDGVVFIDAAGRITVWNHGAESLTGLTRESVDRTQWQPQTIDLRDMEGNAIKVHSCPLLAALNDQKESTTRLTISNRGQRAVVAIKAHCVPVSDTVGTCHGAVMMLHDNSSEQSLVERVETLHNKATCDALTGVANRAEFDRRHEELIKVHRESGEPLGLVICDIDRFKSINDTYGHQAGDAALISFAGLLDGHCRGNDLVARYGGEEFVLLCPGCHGPAVVKKAEEIRKALASTTQEALRHSVMTASFGVSILEEGDTPESMLKRADQGLYEAKEGGRNRVVQFGERQDEQPQKKSWFGWKSKNVEVHNFIERTLQCLVPMELVFEKIRGFVYDGQAQIQDHGRTSMRLVFDESRLPAKERPSERTFVFTVDLTFKPASDGSGTIIEVVLFGMLGRDRRLEDINWRAEKIYKDLRSYLMAEEI